MVSQPAFFEKSAKTGNAAFENQVVTKVKLRHYAYIFVRRLKMMEEAKITFNFISNYEFPMYFTEFDSMNLNYVF
jgi:hypothetical protein